MQLKAGFTILLLLLVCNHLVAQTQNPRYNFKHLNVQNGLAQNIVYHSLQDSRGYIWLGTRNGLTRCDGTHTVNFRSNEEAEKSIGSNFITRILEDPLHQLWIGTDGGVSRYNTLENNFTNFTLLTTGDKNEAAYCVPLGFANKHEMWLLETNSKTIKTFNTQTQKVDSLSSTPAVDGTMWYDSATQLRHIWTYLSSGTIHYVFKNKLLRKEESFFGEGNTNVNEPVFHVVHVLPQNDSTIWISATAGLIELNPNTHSYRVHNKWGAEAVKELRYTAIAPNGILWAATGNNGVYTFDLKAKKFIDNYRNYQLDPFSIGSNNIVSLYFDRVGNIWCGSYGQGVSYTSIERAYFQKALARNEFKKTQGNNNVNWISYDKTGGLWCIMNSEAGVWKLNKNRQISEYHEPVLENGNKFTGRFYKLLFDSSHHAWAIGKEGLFQYDLITDRLRKISYKFFSNDLFGSNWVQDIIQLNDGSYLFCTFSGLYRIISKNRDYIIEPYSELNQKAFTSFAALFQDETGTIYVKDMGETFYALETAKAGFANPVIHEIPFTPKVAQFEIDVAGNRILLATNSGLYQLNRKDYSIHKVSFKKPPPFSSISGLVKKGSRYWLFGEKGLYYYDESNSTSRIFTTEDGLPANEFNFSAIINSPDECIAGTTNGLVSFFPDKLQDTLYPPMVQLNTMYVNDSSTGFISNLQETEKINLEHHQNTFSFDFSPIAFQNADECSFEYQLQGYDQDWIKAGTARYTRYSKIPPGSYTFQLRAIDANGTISPHQKKLKIEIAKAFWQTTLFRVAIAAVILFVVWLMVKWYLKSRMRKQMRHFEKQQAIEKERTRIATDMHDDLGSGLSRIKYLSESIRVTKGADESIKKEMTKIGFYSDEMVEKMGEIVWALNEKNDSIADLIAFTRSYAVEYLSNHAIQCLFEAPEVLPLSFVTGELRRNVFLSVKESLHNIVKHAKATNVSIQIVIEKKLQVIVQDNGLGINKASIRPFSNGLTNIKRRMEEIGGQALFENRDGTIVTLQVPLHP